MEVFRGTGSIRAAVCMFLCMYICMYIMLDDVIIVMFVLGYSNVCMYVRMHIYAYLRQYGCNVCIYIRM